MTTFLTNVAKTEPFHIGDAASALRFDYFTLKDFTAPIILFDHVRMRAAGFPPHPHAGFCVFSYILEDSEGALRDRDSLNREILVEPGDLLWFQMGRGLIHEENPVRDGQLVHQFQVFVNLSRENQSIQPGTFLIKAADVPERIDARGRVRVVVGNHCGMTSPLVPAEPFTLLDIFPESGVEIDVARGWTGLAYVLSGGATITAGGESRALGAGEVIGVREGAAIRLSGSGAHILYMSRPILEQPIVIQGMYVMSRQEDIDAAKRRFHAGGFGEVLPYAKVKHPDRPYVPAGQDPNLTATAFVEKRATVNHYDEGWWKLHLDYCRFEYSDGEVARGYRLVWENPDGREAPYREAGYIPYMEYITTLLAIAVREGWGDIPYRDSF